MNQNQIGFDLITGIYHKLDANKLSGFKGISQGFLEDDMVYGLPDRIEQLKPIP